MINENKLLFFIYNVGNVITNQVYYYISIIDFVIKIRKL